jgi:putative peptidoglycan lipid II flippase
MAPPVRHGGARLVAAGILLSRVFGLVRQRVTAHFLGSGPAADALAAAFRIPNLLQNLFGEGSLSASFIPVYAKLLADGRKEEAGRVAGAVFALLAALVGVIVLIGVLGAPLLVMVVAPGFEGWTRDLTITLVRIIFPGLGLLVLSAWCLGILNTHGRFFLSYASPVAWNIAIVVGLVIGGVSQDANGLVVTVAWASVVGSLLQFAVQLPAVREVERNLRREAGANVGEVKAIAAAFGPAVATRGVSQISAYVDTMFASLLGAGALATLGYAQAISMLPVSLFGMAVSAAELPAMSSASGVGEEFAKALRGRIASGLQRIAFFVIPSTVAFVLLGGPIAAGLYQGGAFSGADAMFVWGALAGSAIGLLSGTSGRLYASASFALRDTKLPFRFAVVRVALAAFLGGLLGLGLPHWLDVDSRWGIAALTAGSGIAAWIEYRLLRQQVEARIGRVRLPDALGSKLWSCAIIAGVAGVLGIRVMHGVHPIPTAIVVLGLFGGAYLGLTRMTGADGARSA